MARLTVAALMFKRLLKKEAAKQEESKNKTEQGSACNEQTLHCTLLLVTEHVVDITAPGVRTETRTGCTIRLVDGGLLNNKFTATPKMSSRHAPPQAAQS
jgi:hypothetical protein